jgi:hypothetical protein
MEKYTSALWFHSALAVFVGNWREMRAEFADFVAPASRRRFCVAASRRKTAGETLALQNLRRCDARLDNPQP